MTTLWHSESVYSEAGWRDDVIIELDAAGCLCGLYDANATTRAAAQPLNGWVLPGFYNAHSHAFQYAMAGATETIAQHQCDDFWHWRETLYRIALTLSPDAIERIATALYTQMRDHGITGVAEFHYLHHDHNGKPYADRAEIGHRLIAAAKTAGIAITLIPIFYQQNDYDTPASAQQRRFISPTLEDYLLLLEASQRACQTYARATLGAGVHSPRAVSPQALLEAIAQVPDTLPFHLHIAEQTRDVERSVAALGLRPVDWLLQNVNLSRRFNLVHATHMTPEETQGLARSGAQVVLCPSTEANLGDGLFPLADFTQHDGRWCIGSDSQVSLSPLEELRWLDYGQRLQARRRHALGPSAQQTRADHLWQQARNAGFCALSGKDSTAYFPLKAPFDAIVVDAQYPTLSTATRENRLAALVYTGDVRAIKATVISGQLFSRETLSHSTK